MEVRGRDWGEDLHRESAERRPIRAILSACLRRLIKATKFYLPASKLRNA
jgi:hypothetical protein